MRIIYCFHTLERKITQSMNVWFVCFVFFFPKFSLFFHSTFSHFDLLCIGHSFRIQNKPPGVSNLVFSLSWFCSCLSPGFFWWPYTKETRVVPDELYRVSDCFHGFMDDTMTSFYNLVRSIAGLQQIPLPCFLTVSFALVWGWQSAGKKSVDKEILPDSKGTTDTGDQNFNFTLLPEIFLNQIFFLKYVVSVCV